MKRLLLFLILTTAAHAQRLETSGTATEFVTSGAFDAAGSLDDIAVLDRATGVFRIGLWNGISMTWSSASSGIETPDFLTAGRLDPAGTTMSLATGSALAQRLECLTPSTGKTFGIGSIGILPTAAVSLPTTGNLLVASSDIFTSGTTSISAYFYNGSTSLIGNLTAGILTMGNPVSQGAAFLANGNAFEVWSPSPVVNRKASLAVAANTRYATGRFGPSGVDSFVLWVPGQTSFQHVAMNAGDIGFNVPTVVNLGTAIGSLRAISSPSFTSDDWLLAISQDGTTARLYNFTPGSAPTLRQSFTAPVGLGFTTATAQGGGHFLLLNGSGGESSGWQRAAFNGTSHTLSANSPLPAIRPSTASPTVFLFDVEPWVNPSASLLSQRDISDWSTLISAGNVTGLTDFGAPTGLGSPLIRPASGIGMFFALPNQVSNTISIASLGATTAINNPVISFTPPPGVYPVTTDTTTALPVPLTVTLGSSTATSIRWRVTGGAWQTYDAEKAPSFSSTTTLEAFAAGASNEPAGPVTRGTYQFGPLPSILPATPIDANRNGLSDEWEKTCGISDPADDADLDGFTNLQEYTAGTDPLDIHSVPSTVPSTFLELRVISSTKTQLNLRLIGTPMANYRIDGSATLAPGGWTNQVPAFQMPTSGYYDFTVPIAAGGKRFFRGVSEP